MDDTPLDGVDEFDDSLPEGEPVIDETPLWAAIRSVKAGMSANASLEAMKAAGLGVRRQDWLSLVREVRAALEANAIDTMQPLARAPFTTEWRVMTTATASGFMQYIDVWVKDRETGEIRIRPYSIRTDDLLTRADAVATAIDRLEQSADLYGERILGAVYTATYVLVPKGR